MLFLLGILVGIIFPLQTAVNSNLRSQVKSPYLAAMVAFIVASIFLGGMTLIQQIPFSELLGNWRLFTTQPWWIWFGGVFGIIGGTIPIILFPHLGSVQTVVLPIFGQILMGMLIDNFGWFRSPVFRFDWIRLFGTLLLLLGLLLVILIHSHSKSKESGQQLVWQFLGLLAGVALASQAAVNGQLGSVLRSPIHAAFISFLTGAVILIIGVGCFTRNFSNLKLALGHDNPWWIWFGGLFGGAYVLGNSFLAPLIGTGATVAITLFGNLAGGLLIDQFGWLGAVKRRTTLKQVLGLILMAIGISLIKSL